MVEVDVFWSYAIGSGFAAAAARQIKDDETSTTSPYFFKTMLYLSTLFAPSGVMLLWAFTGWETMYVWNRETLPAWLVPIFCITNVTQGILGYIITHRLIKSGKYFWANMQWVFGYMAMFFILIHGWDGMGYRRFFTYNPTGAVGWIIRPEEASTLSQSFGPWMALKWTISPVALTLYAMGVVMLPIMFYWIGQWAMEGYESGKLVDVEKAKHMTAMSVVKAVTRVVFIDTLGSVIVWSLLVHLLNWAIGTFIFAAAFGIFGCGPSGFLRKHIAAVTLLGDEESRVVHSTAQAAN